MTKEIKEEIVNDLIEILSLFDIPESKMIEEIARDELTSLALIKITKSPYPFATPSATIPQFSINQNHQESVSLTVV